MPTIYDSEGRAIGIACTRGRTKTCHYCGRSSDRLCDFPLTAEKAGKTCDRPLCYRCTWSPAVERDYCRPHRTLVEQQGQLAPGTPR